VAEKKKKTAKKTTKKSAKKPRSRSYKYLVIVESPAKSKTLEKYLGKDYKVLASMGHIRDLPKSRMAIDIANNFEPYYCIVKGKTKHVNLLKEYAADAERVFLAPDPDREGEAIAWHLQAALNIPDDKYDRIEFNEITKSAVLDSFNHARKIDLNRVNAQQARRCLDRLVGYTISPLLWKRVKRGLSAGRVQSAAMHLICQREQEILAFNPQEYWTMQANYTSNGENFSAKVLGPKGKNTDFTIPDQKTAEEIEAALQKNPHTVTAVNKKERRRFPAAPFITSTLQQEASRRLGFNTRKTMMMAQQLYEGVELGAEGSVGLITYMRTDSTRTAQSALDELTQFVKQNIGPEYGVAEPIVYKQKKSAQDAHEAIRPSSVLREPNTIEQYLNPDQFKVYKLIWRRFVASQMAPAVYDQTSIDIESDGYALRATGSIIKFSGFMKVYEEATDEPTQDESMTRLPELSVGVLLKPNMIEKKQCFTQAPGRFTEASLVKALEEQGIGRPSTYAPIISTIMFRNYVTREGKALKPTELGTVVDKQINKHFPEIVDVRFTAGMEDKLDEVSEGKQDWKKMLLEFYTPFEVDLKKAEETMEDMRIPDRPSDEICEKCGKPMVIKSGRFGDFLACTGFPECKTTKTILKTLEEVDCPICGNPIAERKSKKGRIFYGCSGYPECTFATWDKPLKEKCEKCNSFLVEKKDKESGEKVKLCIKCDLNLGKNTTNEKTDE
jgi:DNA topoisomerase-1